MRISDIGLRLIMESEGLRMVAYSDGAGIPTIGYGHCAGVRLGDRCEAEQAERWLHDDVSIAEAAVLRVVRVALAQGQFDALVDFTFNLGAGALGGSTLLRRLNDNDIPGAATEFLRWVHDGAGHVEPGLIVRRSREQTLFTTGDWA